MNVPNPGIKSDSETKQQNNNYFVILKISIEVYTLEIINLLLVLHIGLTTLTSTMNITAAIIIAANVVLGI